MREAPFITCQGLVRIYKIADLETVALQGLDLEVGRGEILAVVGNSGSGKTTLLNIIGGLDRPSAGRVIVGGENLLELTDRGLARYRREGVGFVWQQSGRNLIPYLTALENVQLPAMIMGRRARDRVQWARELLASVGLIDRAGHRSRQLSGGERQRVAIATAMVNQPPLLLADEPTGEVDGETAATIYAVLRRLREEHGTTIVIVTHDRTIAGQVDRVVAVRDGRVSSELTRREAVGENGEQREARVEELVILDGTGRLQIPAELVARFSLRGRVRVEVQDDHIAILPAEGIEARGGDKR